MPNPELEKTLNAVNKQVIQLSYRWKIFCQLFDSGQDNIELLNKSGSNVFELLQRLILDDAMISLSRLTDPEKSCGNENACIRNLLEKAKNHLESDTVTEVESLISKLDNHVLGIREYRKKALAHTDLEYALNVIALPSVTYEELEHAMETLQSIVNKIAYEAFQRTTQYDPIIPYGCGGDSLLRALKRSHRNEPDNGGKDEHQYQDAQN